MKTYQGEIMEIVKVNGSHKDFFYLSQKLEEFQFNLMPGLKEKGYSLTENLNDIVGYVLYDNDKPIGSIGLKKISDANCEIVRVYVCDEYRGKGYATILFEKIETLAKNMGYKNAEMVAWSKSESAIRLYKKLGYDSTEEKDSEWFVGLKYIEFLKSLEN